MKQVTKRALNVSVMLTRILLILFITSFVYAVAGIVIMEQGIHIDGVFLRPISDYIKIALQCVLGMVVLYLPKLLQKKIGLEFTDGMQIIFVLFLYAAIILGERRNFYRVIPYWDTILHTFSGVMLGAFGFSVVDLLNKSNGPGVKLSPLFVAVFSFCFAVTIDTFWEILEFAMDYTMDLDMQQYKTAEGALLAGRDAIFDTMKDLIVDVLGAIAVCVGGFFMVAKRESSGLA
jgi:uncharacterized membrane protein YjdF